jgi:hypothetical protein
MATRALPQVFGVCSGIDGRGASPTHRNCVVRKFFYVDLAHVKWKIRAPRSAILLSYSLLGKGPLLLPIILIFGEAGAGKDSVARVIVKDFNAVSVAMADPMKRFCGQIFGFDKETLWGPSEKRNAIQPDRLGEMATARSLLEYHYVEWLHDVLPNMTNGQGSEAEQRLFAWFDSIKAIHIKQRGLSARAALQTLGTEFGRAMDPNMWINYARRQLMDLLAGGYTYSPEGGLTASPGKMYSYGVCTDDHPERSQS